MKWKKIALSFLACLFGVLLAGNVFAADTAQKPLPMPTIISPNKNTITSNEQPLISGFTITDSFIKIYIDGIYNGKTSVLKHKSGTAYFSYQPFLKLKRGWHKYSVVAEYKDGRQSRIYNSEFNVEYPMPAPTMLKTLKNKTATASPLAVGLAKNNSRILVYVDNKFDGSFLVKNNKSGTANFAYKVKIQLDRGTHKIYTKAQDRRGKASIKSNPLYYKILEPKISTSAFEDNTVRKTDLGQTLKVEVKKPAVKKTSTSQAGKPVIDQEVQKILDESKSPGTTTAPGSLDENNKSQNKLKTNIIIFILLLLGIIGWIVWVNREMVKERKDGSKDDISPSST
jgi:hypothetical protein